MTTDVHYYIAGPMSGIPQYNIPLFDEVRHKLTERGIRCTSPADLDSEEVREFGLANLSGELDIDERGNHRIGDDGVAETWGDFLARDVKLISDSDINGICFLPGWQHSRGARLEAFVSLLQGEVYSYARWNPAQDDIVPLSREHVVSTLKAYIA